MSGGGPPDLDAQREKIIAFVGDIEARIHRIESNVEQLVVIANATMQMVWDMGHRLFSQDIRPKPEPIVIDVRAAARAAKKVKDVVAVWRDIFRSQQPPS